MIRETRNVLALPLSVSTTEAITGTSLSCTSDSWRPTKSQFGQFLLNRSNHFGIMLFRDGARLGARTLIALGVLAFRTTALVLSKDGLALVTLVEGVLLSEGVAWVAVWVLLLLGSVLLLVGGQDRC